MLAKFTKESWDKVLDQVEFNINNTVNKSTGNTPSRLLFGMDGLTRKTNRLLKRNINGRGEPERFPGATGNCDRED